MKNKLCLATNDMNKKRYFFHLLIIYLTYFYMGSTFASTSLREVSGSSLPKLVECRDKKGSFFSLVTKDDGTSSLSYTGVEKVFAEGFFKLESTVISNNLNCAVVKSQITCTSMEEQIIDIPKAGVYAKKAIRQSVFTIGSFWEAEVRFDGHKSSKHLSLMAQFNIELGSGETLKPIPVIGVNLKSSEKLNFELHKSSIFLQVNGDSAGCEAFDF